MRKYLFILMFAVFPVLAGKYPVITSVRAERVDSYNANIYITQGVAEIGPASDQLIQSTGYYHIMGLAMRWCSGGAACEVNLIGRGTNTNATQTIGVQALDNYNNYSQYIAKFGIGTDGIDYKNSCLGYVASQGNNGLWETMSAVMAPGGCVIIPPMKDWCKITTPEIVLDHGTISLKNAEGSTASSQVGVQCTTPTSVVFNLMTNDSYVYLDEGKSEITVDNKPLNTKIDLAQGDTELAIKDRLTGINSEGLHTGSSVLVMNPY